MRHQTAGVENAGLENAGNDIVWNAAHCLCLLSFAGSKLECDRYRSVVNQIARLAILSKCRKRAAEEEVPLRQIFDDVCRTAGTSAQELAFAEVKSSMYKRRRAAMPSLPRNPQSSDEAVLPVVHRLRVARRLLY